MSAITSHADTSILSAFLDDQLPEEEKHRVEEHVAMCPGCRADLDSLRRVVDGLRFSERMAPPPLLAQSVARRVAIEAAPSGFLERVERLLDLRLPLASSTLAIFASVLAMAAIGLFFSRGVEMSQRFASENAGAELVSVVWQGRTFDRRVSVETGRATWVERGALPPSRQLDADRPEARALLDDLGESVPWLAAGESVILFDAAGDSVEIATTAQSFR